MPYEGWLTVGSAVTVVEKNSLKSTPLQLVFHLYPKQRDGYKHERSVKLLTLLSPIAGLWKACSCPDAVHQVISETWCTLPVCSCHCGITRWLLPVSCYCCNGNIFPNRLLNLPCFSLSRFLLTIPFMDMNFSLVSLQIATFYIVEDNCCLPSVISFVTHLFFFNLSSWVILPQSFRILTALFWSLLNLTLWCSNCVHQPKRCLIGLNKQK